MLLQVILLAFPMSLAWVILARQPTIGGLIIGYVFGFAIILVIRSNIAVQQPKRTVSLLRIPQQIFSLLIYGLRLAWDVFLSGINVAGIVLNPAMPIKPGVYRIPTQDESKNDLIAALSAHSITITPGELVIDYEEDADNIYMLVHTLDREASNEAKLTEDQRKRLKLIKGILGYE